MAMPTFEQILSRYLFNQDTHPAPEELKDENFIRPTDAKGDPIEVNMYEYMTEGGGRFADVSQFQFVRDFLAGVDFKRDFTKNRDYAIQNNKIELKPGIYSTKDILELYGIEGLDKDGEPIPVERAYLGVIQRYYGLSDPDYKDRVFVFNSTEFKINDDAKFIVHEDGTREIHNIYVVPVDDGFDYKSADWYAQLSNLVTGGSVDPSGIGREVPLEFVDEGSQWKDAASGRIYTNKVDPVTGKSDLDLLIAINSDFAKLKSSEIESVIQGYKIFVPAIEAELNNEGGILRYTDEKGNYVIYDGKDVNHDLYRDMFMATTNRDGLAVIAGGGNDTLRASFSKPSELYGGKGDDLLVGNAKGDLLDGGEGNDTLVSGTGNDTLHGGQGFDSYKFFGKFGHDTVMDTDGAGAVLIGGSRNGLDIAGGYRVGTLHKIAEGVYQDGDIRAYYPEGSANLLIVSSVPGHEGQITILNWKDGDLGIKLQDEEEGVEDIADDLREPFNRSMLVDPLVLDLNGNGIETLGLGSGVYFDHDANGFAELSGWVGPNDGLLVLDRNGNGLIDDGTELFGDSTALSNGKKAANGFLALADFDENRDGVINAKDAIYSQLRVWVDRNSNGRTDEGELLTLEEAGVASIDLSYRSQNVTDAHGNRILQVGNYTDFEGNEHAIADVWFAAEKSSTVNKDLVEIPEALLSLPEIGGCGNVHSLRQAMARDETGALQALVGDWLAESDPAAKAALVDQVLFAWTGAGKYAANSRGDYIDGRKLYVLEAFLGEGFLRFNSSNPDSNAALELMQSYQLLADYVSAQFMAQTSMRYLYEMLDGQYGTDGDSPSWTLDISQVLACFDEQAGQDEAAGAKLFKDFLTNLKTINSEYTLFVLGQLKGAEAQISHPALIQALFLFDKNPVFGDDGDNTLIGSTGDDALTGGKGNDRLEGGAGNDTYVFSKGDGQDTIYDVDITAGNIDTIKFTDVLPGEIRFGRLGNDLVIHYGEGDSITVFNHHFFNYFKVEQIAFADGTVQPIADLLRVAPVHLTDGNDNIAFGDGDDTVYAGGGNDLVRGGRGNDVLYGEGGNDTLYGEIGNDTLIGGKGNDRLEGGSGNDTYVFSKGDGQDTIFEEGGTDTIQFTDVLPGEARFFRTGNDLVIRYGEKDSITVLGYYSDSARLVEQIVFADGTVQAIAELLLANPAHLNDDNDNYPLYGSEGNDILYGHSGNDTLTGGKGNDRLEGGAGNDTYVFSKGDGQDTIVEIGGTDTIQFTDVLPGEISFWRSGDNLIIRYGVGDSITVLGHYSSTSRQIEQVAFADGTVQTLAALLLANPARLTDGNDTLIGSDGDDTLYGERGNDTLIGGKGNDRLEGGADNDTYVFSKGDGQDTIFETSGTDTIQFTDVLPGDILFGRSGDDLIIRYGNGDSITVLDHYSSPSRQVEHIEFAGGTRQSVAELLRTNPIYLTDGNDNVVFESGRDGGVFIHAGDGDDTVKTGSGNDTLIGGKGNDRLEGGTGDDTYVFSKGDGQDTIYDNSEQWESDGTDTIKFTDVLPGEIRFGRSGDDLIIRYGNGDSITVLGHYHNSNLISSPNTYRIEQIAFADGTTQSIANLLQTNPIYLTDGNDDVFFYSWWGSDVIVHAGDGDDTVNAGSGNDTLIGGRGNDRLEGGAGNDTYVFSKGDGQDTVYDTGGMDIIKFTDVLPGEIRFGASGNDLIVRYGEGDSITVLDHYNGTNRWIEQIEFADGTKHAIVNLLQTNPVHLTDGNDNVVFGSGSGNNVIVHAGDGDDTVKAGSGNDTLIGGRGNDRLEGGSGNDTYVFSKGDGQDTIDDFGQLFSPGGTDTIKFTDVLPGEISFWRSDNDLIIRYGEDDSITLLRHYGGNWFEQIEFADGTMQTLTDLLRTNSVHLTDGNDNVTFGGQDDMIHAGDGDDTVNAGSGNDTLIGGRGNDRLEGGAGNDTYVFSKGDGQDTVYDTGGMDIIKFTDVLPGEIRFGASGNDLIVRYGEGDSITVLDHYNGTNRRIEQVEFADGSMQTLAELLRTNPIYLTDGNDDCTFGSDDDIVHGGGGNDTIRGGFGNDTLYGDEGNDVLYGESGNDVLIGGKGNDRLEGGAGNDTYVFSKGDGQDIIYDTGGTDTIRFTDVLQDEISFWRFGDDLVVRYGEGDSDSITVLSYYSSTTYRVEQIAFADGMTQTIANLLLANPVRPVDENVNLLGGGGSDTLYGKSGNDTLTGGKGNDHLEGGVGNDTYVFSKGDGQDTILDISGTDTIKFTDVLPGEIRFGASGSDLIIRYGEGDSITVLDHFSNTSCRIEQIEFADGSKQTIANLLLTNPIYLTDGNDDITLGAENDIVYAGDGDDTVKGGAGNDIIYGGDGNDALYGESGNDTLIGGRGNDRLDGGAGNDTYVFSKGDGQDTIFDSAGTDTIKFTDVLPGEIRFGVSGNDLVIRYGEGDSIAVSNHFNNTSYRVEQIEFADGTKQTIANLLLTNPIYLTDGNDNVTLGNDNDIVHAGDGDDTVNSGSGNDTLIGGRGNDRLEGGAGNDTYVFSKGDGQDTIFDTSGTDTIKFTDVLPGEISFGASGSDLIVRYGEGDSITVSNHYSNTSYRIEQVEFADGTKQTIANLLLTNPIYLTDGDDDVTLGNENDIVYGGEGNDTINGGNGNDTLYGGEGNDRLDGGPGNDVLIGGKGNDRLNGGSGDDTYVFSKGDGQDAIFETGGTDTIQFTDVLPGEISFARLGEDLVIRYGEGDRITVLNHYSSSAYRVERIEFADGTVQSINNLLQTNPVHLTDGNDNVTFDGWVNVFVHAGDGNDTVISGDGNDTLVGGKGNDRLEGGSGNDTYVFSKGDGQDTIVEEYGTDTIKFTDVLPGEIRFGRSGDSLVIHYGDGDSITVLGHYGFRGFQVEQIEFADGTKHAIANLLLTNPLYLTDGDDDITLGSEDDIVYAGDGDDTVNGGNGNDILYGEGGNDILNGGYGNDTLIGGKGNDYLIGGSGNDTYVFSKGDGQDTIYDFLFGTDTIQFTDVLLDEIHFWRSGNNLVVRYGEGDSITVLSHYNDSSCRVENIEFADGTTHAIANLLLTKPVQVIDTGEDDIVIGGSGPDSLFGDGGNDTLYGNGGNDTLTGGKGNDHLEGGTGDDIYVFSKGDGQDTVFEAGGMDTIKFTDVLPGEISFLRSGVNLVVCYGEGDSITVLSYYSDSNCQIEQIEFADGTKQSLAELLKTNPVDDDPIDDDPVDDDPVDDDPVDDDPVDDDPVDDDPVDDDPVDDDPVDDDPVDDDPVDDDPVDDDPTDDDPTDDDPIDDDPTDDDPIDDDPTDDDPVNDVTIRGGSGNDTLTGGKGNDTLYGEGGNDTLIGGLGNDRLEGGAGNDTYVFSVGDGQDTVFDSGGTADVIRFTDVLPGEISFGRAGNNLIIRYGEGDSVTVLDHYRSTANRVEQIEFADGTKQTVANLLLSNPFYLTDGNDNVTFGSENDTVYAGAGDDIVRGGTGNDVIYGGEGNDTLYGDGGNDTLIGGVGNDRLEGGAGNDTYVFSVGDGQDTVYDSGGTDTIKFTDVLPGGISFGRLGNNLIIRYGEGDSVTVLDHYRSTANRVEQIEFADGTKQTVANLLLTNPFYLTDGNDSVTFGSENDTVYAGAGDDIVRGGTGNDVIYGGEGNDTLYGEGGNDTLIGGVGNDRLEGGAGNDTYVFSKGDGQDMVYDSGGTDTIKFTDVLPGGINFGRLGNNLIIRYGEGDSVTVLDHYRSSANRVEQIEFADGTKQTVANLLLTNPFYLTDGNDSVTFGSENDTVYAGAGDDIVRGGNGNDIIYGGEGNDTLYGDGGNDTLIGGVGNDRLEGGAGNDTYVFSKGDGQDMVYDSGGTDTIKFTDVLLSEVSYWRSGNNLIIRYGEDDSVTVLDHYRGTANRVEQVEFADGTKQTVASLLSTNILYLTDGNDNITFGSENDIVHAGAGDDIVRGGTGNDVIYGGEGNDTLYGDGGNDTLIGGIGNDRLEGGAGNDTYVFSKGDGQDMVYDSGGTDTIKFTDVLLSEVSYWRSGNNLIIRYGEDDSVTVLDHYRGTATRIEQIEFADGPAQNLAQSIELIGVQML